MMEASKFTLITFVLASLLANGAFVRAEQKSENNDNVYMFNATDIDGNLVSFEKYRGYVLLVVNVASECGLTESNYKQLNDLYTKFKKDGLRIAAFPSNQFNQEPGDNVAIKKFIKSKDVHFDVYSKIDVNGDNAHPLYKWLKGKLTGFLYIDAIKWNFTKFLVDFRGQPIKRYGPLESPSGFEADIMAQLARRSAKQVDSDTHTPDL